MKAKVSCSDPLQGSTEVQSAGGSAPAGRTGGNTHHRYDSNRHEEAGGRDYSWSTHVILGPVHRCADRTAAFMLGAFGAIHRIPLFVGFAIRFDRTAAGADFSFVFGSGF